MKYNPENHKRKSIRLPHYDYSQEGVYFITICTQGHECFFGEIIGGEMLLNHAGEMIRKWWIESENKFKNFENEIFVIMPNHFHGIVVINNHLNGRGRPACLPDEKGEHIVSPLRGPSLCELTQWFKTMTTNEYIRGVKMGKYPPFEKRLWQRNYYEHIIRNERSFETIQDYIIHNPEKWEDDKFFRKNA